jgi:Leucine-rich repeat (LRR) protein
MNLQFNNLIEIPNNLPNSLKTIYLSLNEIREIKNLPDLK